uniref:Uncharacterized protein n=1 Tax=Anguilla anguilla TaxID=7936 RepID=A0A0E9R2V7_ANGAN
MCSWEFSICGIAITTGATTLGFCADCSVTTTGACVLPLSYLNLVYSPSCICASLLVSCLPCSSASFFSFRCCST